MGNIGSRIHHFVITIHHQANSFKPNIVGILSVPLMTHGYSQHISIKY